MSSRDDIRIELASHIADMADDLARQGVVQDEAIKRARTAFGNIEQHIQQTVAIERQRPFVSPSLLAVVGVAVGVVISLGYWLRQYPLTGVVIQPVLLSAVYLGVFGIFLLAIKWITEYFGLRSRRALWAGLLFGVAVSVSVTIINDLDRVFVPLNATAIGVLLAMVMSRAWVRLPVWLKRAVVFGFPMVTAWSALHGKAMLGFLRTQPCVYLTRDNVPLTGALAGCQQLSWLHPILWPVYFLVVASVLTGVYFLIAYWRNQVSALGRKVVLTAVFAAIPLLPMLTPDLNNYGQVDIISWKPDIYQAYQDILDRDPEAKDLEFYGRTRSYTSMRRVKEALYRSHERELVIEKIFQEELERTASQVEIQHFITGRQSVEEIRNLIGGEGGYSE